MPIPFPRPDRDAIPLVLGRPPAADAPPPKPPAPVAPERDRSKS